MSERRGDQCQAFNSFTGDGQSRGLRCTCEATHTHGERYRLCYAHAHALTNAHRVEPLKLTTELSAVTA